MNNNMINYSIIIPHYKNVELLNRCVSTIPSRSDIEIIIIDDHSEIDKEIFYSYESLKRKNVQIHFLMEGGNAGRARNVGLKYAKGKWLIFVDADDFIIDEEFILCDKYNNSKYDIIYFGVSSVDSDTLQKVERYKVYNKYIDLCDNISEENINMLRFRHDVPWGKMIRHELVKNNNIFFGETKYCNDTLFSTVTALYAKSVFAEKSLFYCVTERRDSLTKQRSIDSEFIRYEVMLNKNQILKKHGFSRYQISVLYYLMIFVKNDIKLLFKALNLAFKYRVNPFIGFFESIRRKINK